MNVAFALSTVALVGMFLPAPGLDLAAAEPVSVPGTSACTFYDIPGCPTWWERIDGEEGGYERDAGVVVTAVGTAVFVYSTDAHQDESGTTRTDMVVAGLDAATGAMRWTWTHNGSGNGDDTPLALWLHARGSIVIVASSTLVSDGTISSHVLRIEALDGETGARLWNRTQPFPRFHDPALGYDVFHDMIIVSTTGQRGVPLAHWLDVTAYDAASGALTWTTQLSINGPFWEPVLAKAVGSSERHVVISLGVRTLDLSSDDLLLVSLDGETGAHEWTTRRAGAFNFVGRLVFLDEGAAILHGSGRILSAYASSSGAHLWSMPVSDGISTIVVSHGLAVLNEWDTGGTRTFALNGAGEVVWSTELPGVPFVSEPTMYLTGVGAGEEVAFVGVSTSPTGSDVDVIVHDATTGVLLKRFTFDAEPGATGSVGIVIGSVGSRSGIGGSTPHAVGIHIARADEGYIWTGEAATGCLSPGSGACPTDVLIGMFPKSSCRACGESARARESRDASPPHAAPTTIRALAPSDPDTGSTAEECDCMEDSDPLWLSPINQKVPRNIQKTSNL